MAAASTSSVSGGGGRQRRGRDDTGMTPLRCAVRHGRDDLAELLRAAGADTAAVSDEDRRIGAVVAATRATGTVCGARASSAAGFEDRDLLAMAACRNDAALVRRILAAGADPNALVGGTEALPPLHWACWRGQRESTRALLEAGADVHQRNRYGGDALGAALHGSLNCHDVLGGPTTKLPDEIAHGELSRRGRDADRRGRAAPGARRGRRCGGGNAAAPRRQGRRVVQIARRGGHLGSARPSGDVSIAAGLGSNTARPERCPCCAASADGPVETVARGGGRDRIGTTVDAARLTRYGPLSYSTRFRRVRSPRLAGCESTRMRAARDRRADPEDTTL